MSRTMAFLFLIICFSTASADEPTPEQAKRAEEIKKAIADKKSEIAKLEAELEKLQPKVELKFVEYLFANDLIPNTVGYFGMVSSAGGRTVHDRSPIIVDTVIDKERMLITVPTAGKGVKAIGPTLKILVIDYDTTGLVDGKVIIEPPKFRVIGTEKHDGKTLYVVKKHKP